MKYWNLFGLQVQQAGYQGTVLPIMLVAFILSHVEKFFHKVLKGTIDFIFTPTLTILDHRLPDLPVGRTPDVPSWAPGWVKASTGSTPLPARSAVCSSVPSTHSS